MNKHSQDSVRAPQDDDTVPLPDQHVRLTVRSSGLTDVGQVRETNEDQFLIAVLRKTLHVQRTSLPVPKLQQSDDQSHLFVVADGMVWSRRREKASALAIDSVDAFLLDTFQWFAHFKGKEEDKLLTDFQGAVARAHARLLAEAAERPELRGMGTTLTLAYTLNDMLFVAHVGDSRCYLFRNGHLYRLTSDHTLVDEMVRRGVLKAEDAAHHQWRHVITNAVGGSSADLQVEVHKVHLEAGNIVLLCSDGLTNMVSEDKIAAALETVVDPELACKNLVEQANAEGGTDNITVIVASFEKAQA